MRSYSLVASAVAVVATFARAQAPPPGRRAHVMEDEFRNVFQGYGYDAACTYTP